MSKIIGKKPRYPTGMDTPTLASIEYEKNKRDRAGLPVLKHKKIKKKEFVSCADCANWATTKVVEGKTYGKCSVGVANCPNM